MGRLDNIDRSLSEIYTSVQVSKSSLPKTLGFPWQGDNSGNTIYFEDVLGRTMDLPAVFCRDLRVCRIPLISCMIFEVSAAADQHILVISRHIGDHISGPSRLQNNLQW